MYANGAILSTASDLIPPTGRVGLYANSSDAGLDARFDNVRIYNLAGR
jgi:hypothetical protein